MGKKAALLVVYGIVFVVGLGIVLCSESIAQKQASVVDKMNPNVSMTHIEDIERKMIPLNITGGVLALIAGNGIIVTISRRD